MPDWRDLRLDGLGPITRVVAIFQVGPPLERLPFPSFKVKVIERAGADGRYLAVLNICLRAGADGRTLSAVECLSLVPTVTRIGKLEAAGNTVEALEDAPSTVCSHCGLATIAD